MAAQIALYQAELEGILGRGVERASRTETVGNWLGSRLAVSYGPVHSITSMAVGGVSLTPSQYGYDRNTIEPWGFSYVGPVTVVYDGGWEPPRNVPAKSAVVARTARWLNKRTDDDVGVEQSQVEGHNVKWMADGFTAEELKACERLRAPDLAG